MQLIHTVAELRALLAETTDAPSDAPCACGLNVYTGWSSLTEERWPAALMTQLATLRDPEIYEPTFEEYHPAGTRYDDPAAPVAPAFFPYNRCNVWRCQSCRRLVLRYTEFGGYYVDHRVRMLNPDLIVG